MCGIIGLFHQDGRPADPAMVGRMAARLAHRGPDGQGVWTDGPIGLGHRRLAIRGLGPDGHQPMLDPGGLAVVSYNGEIYNDSQLRRDIARDTGWNFRTKCDTEVLLAGFLAWGEAVFNRLEGMFAAAIWDVRRRRLVLARDAAGVKPLWLWRRGGLVAFASEPKALLPELAQRSIDPGALHAFLAQGYVGPAGGLVAGLEQLPPGSVAVLEDGQWQEQRFWRPTRHPDIRHMDEAVEAFLQVWRRVVPSMLVSEVPVGVLQSGGIDSSLVSSEARRHSQLPLFVAAFDEASHDETVAASEVARTLGAALHRVPVGLDHDAEAAFRATVRAVDGHLADASTFAAWILAREVRRHVTVALSGDGADEFFAGYKTYGATVLAHRLKPLVPSTLAHALGRRLALGNGGDERRLPPRKVASRFLLGLTGREPHVEWRRLLPAFLIAELYGPGLRPMAESDPLAAYAAASGPAPSRLDSCLLADQSYYLPADMLIKMDCASMAHGLEVRVPFLTRAVMDLAARLDRAVLLPRGGQPKAPLRLALASYGLPASITHGTKRGFNVPVDRLLRGPLAGLAGRLLDEDADILGPWLRPDCVRRLWRDHRDRRKDWGYTLWAVLTLAAWFEDIQ